MTMKIKADWRKVTYGRSLRRTKLVLIKSACFLFL